MSKITELQEKRARVWKQAKDFLDEKQKENDVLSAEDNTTYERMEKEVINLGKEIDRLHKQTEIEAELNQPTSHALTNIPNNGKQV
ncbi:hypothetical protein QP288_26265, partial [Escherichia coli]|nr:hypothetical protein [Escherichia coli]